MRKITIVLVSISLALTGAPARADIVQSEPIAAKRVLPILLVDATTGAPLAGVTGATVQLHKTGGSWVSATNSLSDQSNGAYELQLTAAEVDTVGPFWYRVSKPGTIRDFADVIPVSPLQDALRYGTAQSATSTTIRLDASASATTNYYAGGGQSTVVAVVGGTGAGQARLATAYNGSTKDLTIAPAWATTPDSTSVFRVESKYTGLLDAAAIASIQAGLASSASIAAIPTNPLLTTDARLNDLDATISSRASSVAVAAIPTNPLLTNDARLNHLDADISTRATDAHVLAIPTNPLLTSDVRLNDLDATISSRASAAGLAAIPTNPLLTNDGRLAGLAHLDVDVSTRATDAHVLAIPTNPLLTSDLRLNDLDATISSRSTQTSVNLIPTNPELASDARLAHLDVDVSSRLAPSVAGRTLAIAATGQAGIDWANIAGPTATQNLTGTTIAGGGGGGGGATAQQVVDTLMATVMDPNADATAQTFKQVVNLISAYAGGDGAGLDGPVGSISSLSTLLPKHRIEFQVISGKRTIIKRDGN